MTPGELWGANCNARKNGSVENELFLEVMLNGQVNLSHCPLFGWHGKSMNSPMNLFYL